MFSPEKQQVEICLLKSNLEEIENDILAQRSALPTLDTENELKYRETMSALKVVRSFNSEIERLKEENVRLTAKRMQLKRHCEDISRELERARRNRSELVNLLKQEEDDTEEEIRKYEDFLRNITDFLRKTRVYHNDIPLKFGGLMKIFGPEKLAANEDQIKAEIESLHRSNIEFVTEERKKQNTLIELQREFDLMESAVPQNLLDIVGKKNLDEKLKAQWTQYEAVCVKRNNLFNCRQKVSRFVFTRNMQ